MILQDLLLLNLKSGTILNISDKLILPHEVMGEEVREWEGGRNSLSSLDKIWSCYLKSFSLKKRNMVVRGNKLF